MGAGRDTRTGSGLGTAGGVLRRRFFFPMGDDGPLPVVAANADDVVVGGRNDNVVNDVNVVAVVVAVTVEKQDGFVCCGGRCFGRA